MIIEATVIVNKNWEDADCTIITPDTIDPRILEDLNDNGSNGLHTISFGGVDILRIFNGRSIPIGTKPRTFVCHIDTNKLDTCFKYDSGNNGLRTVLGRLLSSPIKSYLREQTINKILK